MTYRLENAVEQSQCHRSDSVPDTEEVLSLYIISTLLWPCRRDILHWVQWSQEEVMRGRAESLLLQHIQKVGSSLQSNLDYPNLDYPNPRLSKLQSQRNYRIKLQE